MGNNLVKMQEAEVLVSHKLLTIKRSSEGGLCCSLSLLGCFLQENTDVVT